MAKSSMLIRVHYGDGRVADAVAGPKAQVMVERHFGTTIPKLTDGGGAEHGYYLAWAALTAAKRETREFDDFLDAIDDIEVLAEEDAPAGPTESARPPDSSLS